MRLIFLTLIFAALCVNAQAQTYTFHCIGEYISGANCPECTGTTTSRLFNGLAIRKSGAYFKNIDCPFIVKVQGSNLVFQEILYPNPETVTINLLATGYANITEFRDSVACPCAMQDTSATGGGGGGTTETFTNSSDATSHTVTLTPGTTSLQLVEGTGIGIATTGSAANGIATLTNTLPDQVVSITGGGINVVTGTYPNFTVTGTEVDGSVTNEGILGVDAGGANTSVVTSNTSGATGVTVSGSNTILVTESTSSNGGTITLQGDTSLLATVNDINAARNGDDSTFVKLSGSYANKRITDAVYRYGTTGFRTLDTSGIVNIRAINSDGKTPLSFRYEGATSGIAGSMMWRANLKAYNSALWNLGAGFQISSDNGSGGVDTRPNTILKIGHNNSGISNIETGLTAFFDSWESYYYTDINDDGIKEAGVERHIIYIDSAGYQHRPMTIFAPYNANKSAAIDFATNKFRIFGTKITQTARVNINTAQVVNSPFSVANDTLGTYSGSDPFHTAAAVFFSKDRASITGNEATSIYLRGSEASNSLAGIRGQYTTTNKSSNFDLIFSTQGNNSTGVQEDRMTIKSGATTLVGINETSPAQTLDVEGTARITGSDGTSTTVMGRDGDGDVSAITVGSGLSLSANTLSATGGGTNYQTWRDDGTPATQRPNANFVSNSDIAFTLTDDAGNTETEVTADIPTNAVDNSELRQSAALSVIGRSANSTGNVSDISGTDGQYLEVRDNVLGFYENIERYSMTRTMPTAVNSVVYIGTVTKTNGVATIYIDVNAQGGGGVSVAKTYQLASYFNSTGAVWQVAPCIASTGVYSGQDFQVEIRSNGSTDSLRIRRTVGTVAATGYILLGITPGSITSFTEYSGTASGVPAVTTVFSLNGLHNEAGNVGIKTISPAQTLHVQGTARITGSDGTSTTITGRDGDGDISAITVGAGLLLSANTLSTTAANTSLTRTMPTVVGNTVQIGFFTKSQGAADYKIDVVVPASGVSIAKSYIVSSFYNGTSSAWQVLPPITSSGAFSGHDFVVEIKGINLLDSLRIRRTAGTSAATAYVDLSWGAAAVTSFTALSGTDNPTAITTVYSLGALAQAANKVGIGVVAPVNKLDVEGAAVIGATYSGTNTAPTNGLLVEGSVGIGNTSPQRTLHVTGETRITDLATDTPTKIIGADGDGDLDTVGIGGEAELHLTNGTLGTNLHTTISPSILTAGMTNNWNPTNLSTAWIIRISGDDKFEILTGITAPSFAKRLAIHNVGSNAILFATDNTSSTAGNRFSFGRDIVLFAGKSIEIIYDPTTARWRLLSKAGIYDDVEQEYLNKSFQAPVSLTSGDYDFWTISSTGTATAVAPVDGLLRAVSVNTGSSSTGGGYVASKEQFVSLNTVDGSATWGYVKAKIVTPANLSDGTNNYTLRIGFLASTLGSDLAEGAYFYYNHSISGGAWSCFTQNAGSSQNNNSGITVSASTIYTLEVVYRPNISVEFFINGTRVATNDTNVPDSDAMKVVSEIEKQAGTSQRDLQVYLLQTSIAHVN